MLIIFLRSLRKKTYDVYMPYSVGPIDIILWALGCRAHNMDINMHCAVESVVLISHILDRKENEPERKVFSAISFMLCA